MGSDTEAWWTQGAPEDLLPGGPQSSTPSELLCLASLFAPRAVLNISIHTSLLVACFSLAHPRSHEWRERTDYQELSSDFLSVQSLEINTYIHT